MIRKITVRLLKRELEQVEHDLISLSISQDVVVNVDLFYKRYEEVRKSLILLIEYLN